MMILCGTAQAESSITTNTPVPVILQPADMSALRLVVPKAQVVDVIDGVAMVVKNIRNETTTVRLAGVWVPWESQNNPGINVQAARDMLIKNFGGRMVKLYQPKKASEENLTAPLNQSLVIMVRDDGAWAQGMLLQLGLGTVVTNPGFEVMQPQLQKAEQSARAEKLGLWGNPKWGVLPANDAPFSYGQYRVVQGKVHTTYSRNNRVYIAFGPDAAKDLTIVISAASRLKFARAGINIMGLNGQDVEARGFVQNLDGPVIIITEPSDLKPTIKE